MSEPANRNEELLRLGILAAVRFLSLAALPIDAILGYGDYLHFFSLAEFSSLGAGLPWLGHWVEFPPLFPYLSLGIHNVAGGSQHVYAYLLALTMLAFDLGNLWLVGSLSKKLWDPRRAGLIAWVYMGFLVIPAFGWWTFDPMAVFYMLLAANAFYQSRPYLSGIAAGVGALVKFLPVLPLVLFWRFRPRREAFIASGLTAAILVVTLAPLFAAEPEMATASLRSQASKGSWETVWALIDGNDRTGAFGALEDRLDPELAYEPRGNPAVVPTWIPALIALGIGAWAVFRAQDDPRAQFALVGLLLSLVFLASPGWSPQWLAYLIPIVLLSLVMRRAALFSFSLALVTLLEWPILLSRGRFELLALPVLLRTLLMILLAFELWRVARERV
ncbi:MAG: glycosyltransferase 87 family protein [Chloroflexi bacterium]|nr:glycosyltransferase 87 family protein [Chloroflexota bacterium]